MKKKMLNAVIYARTAKGMDDIAIDEQIDTAMEFAESRDNLCVVDIIADKGFNGVALQRPGFIQIIGMLVTGEADCIIVDDLCRVSSNMLELAYLMVHILPELKAEMFFNDMTLDCDDPENPHGCLTSVLERYTEAFGVDEVHIDDVEMHFVR